MIPAHVQSFQTSRRHVVALAMCLLLLLAPIAHADSYSQAGMIIDYGDGRTTWVWVPFEEHEITVYQLLQRTGLELVTVGFGGMGEAICQIDDTGCGVTDCRTRLCQTNSSSPFWRLTVLDDDTWRMTGTGVGGAMVGDGDIYALSWSNETPNLPVITIDALASNAGADTDAENPRSALRADGRVATPEGPPSSWWPAAGTLALVVMIAVTLVYRSRSVLRASA